MNIGGLISQMIILFGIIITGYIAAKAKVMTTDLNKQLSRIVTMFVNPMSVLASVCSGSRPLGNKEVLIFTGIAVAMYFFLILVSKLVSKLLRAGAKESSVFEYLFIFSNVSFMGYPVIESLFGTEYTFYATVFVMSFQLFCWTYGVSLMVGERMRFSVKIFKRPMIIAAILAYIIYFLNIPCPTELYGIFKTVGSMTSPIAMLIIGCSLAQMPIRDVFSSWKIYILAFVKMLLVPVLAWLALRNVITDKVFLGVLIVILSMPSATNATILSYQYGADDRLASRGVFVTTLISVVSIPLIMYFLFTCM